MTQAVTLLGFGEAAMCFAEAGVPRGWAARAYDKLTDDPAAAPAKRADCARLRVQCAGTVADAVAGADLILSLVTADQAVRAAEAAASSIRRGALFCDFNSAAPHSKQDAARHIEAAGGRYVDVAVMAPVRPAALAVPLLVAGPAGDAGMSALTALGFAPHRAGDRIGDAAAIKLLRSIMVKGIEALAAECFIAASRAGLANQVAASLEASWPGTDWLATADYNVERMMSHGLRRAAEMEEAAAMLEAWGLPSVMAHATVEAQRAIGARRLAAPAGLDAKAAALAYGEEEPA